MCGRYSLFTPWGETEERFDANFTYDFEPRYNAAPSQELPVITDTSPDTIQCMEWGLVPSWADERSEHGYINARGESLADTPSFAAAYESQRRSSERRENGLDTPTAGRCLVPSDGFYEWTQQDGGKQPYRVSLPDDDPFAMAGLYERWEPPQRQTGLGEFGTGSGDGGQDDVIETFTVVTTEPNDTVADLHHRMAVILDPEEERQWLHGDIDDVNDLLDPYDGALQTYPISTAVNDPSNDSAEIIEPVNG